MPDKDKDKPKLKLVSTNKSNPVKQNDKAKLTSKQLGFCKDIVYNGMTLIDAYCNNYNVSEKTKGNSLRAMASKLRADINITLTINKLLDEKDRLNKMQEGKKEEIILNKLMQFADDENINDAVRVRSLELLGKNLGLWTENISIENKDKTSEEIEFELKNKLKKLLDTSGS